MLIANEPKFEEFRNIVDEEVTKRTINNGITRKQAYIDIARDLGFVVRAYSCNEGRACVIAMSDLNWIYRIAERILRRRRADVLPMRKALRVLREKIDSDIYDLRQMLSSGEVCDSNIADKKLEQIEQDLQESDRLRRSIRREERKIITEFVDEFCNEIKNQVVVFGVTFETAMIAAILRILDPKCDIFLSSSEIRSLYTRQDLLRKSGAVQSSCLAEISGPALPFLDGNGSGYGEQMLAKGLARMIDGFLSSSRTESSAQ